MASRSYPHLFSPLQVGPVTLRNRVVLSAMTTGFGFRDGVPTDDLLAYFRARTGGVAMAVVAFGAVAPEGRVEEQVPWLWREDAGRVLAPLAAAIAEGGGLPCLQLGHGGRQVSPRVTGRPPVAPSPLPPRAHVTVPPEPLTTAAVEEVVAAFGRAAARAAEAGFAAVEVHAAHGYLVQQFLSAESNRRDDRYGGATVAERARFGVEVVRAVRAAAPDLAVLVRINGDDLVAGGLTPADAAVAAAAFVDAGAHALVVSAGVYGSVPYTIPLLDDPEATFLAAAAHVRAHVDVPVVAVGRLSTPASAEAALARGACDAVAVGRGLLADPHWVEKAAGGRAERIRPCIATVQGCAGMLQHGEPISCAVNPAVGREAVAAPVAATPRRVVVVGGGPAGMEAARRAAELGHEVVLLERAERLGGALRLAAATPPLQHLARLLAWYERELAAAGVDVRLGVTADAATVAGLGGDLVVAAVGGRTEIPVLDGYEDLAAWTTESLLAGEESTRGTTALPGRVVVAGGGQRALATALWCAARGAEVALLAPGRLGADTSGLARRAFLARLDRYGVTRLAGRPVALDADGVAWRDGDGRQHHEPADGFVVAEPLQPERGLGIPDAVVVGDGREVRGIPAAIAEARDAVDAFTRAAAA